MNQLSLDEPSPTAASGSRVLKLTVAYDGTDFHGFAAQPDTRTVEGVLGDVLARVLRVESVSLSCAGRTDAGVHAWGQVVSTPVEGDVDVDKIARGDEQPARARGRGARRRASSTAAFDARHSARWRAYRYTIVNRPAPDPFLARTAWWVPEPLDLSLLRLGADPFLGEHDFATFCRKGPAGSTTVRRVLESQWHDLGDGVLRYDITATAFCWQMVRSIVGTLGRRRRGEDPTRRHPGHPARAGPQRGRKGRRTSRAVPLGSGVLSR